MKILPIKTASLATVLQLNNDAVPAVNALDAAQLSALVMQSSWARIVSEEEKILAFVIALGPGCDYHSPNYRWFAERYQDFLYIDRIVVAANTRGSGIGTALYQTLAQQGSPPPDRLTCEVNLYPPNPDSIAFHKGLGFLQVGQQDTEEGRKRVALMCWELTRKSG